MAVQERTIELTVISGSDLKKVKKFGFEQKCFAQVFIYPTQKRQTEEDLYGGVNPNWNEKMTLTCYESHIHPPSDTPASSTSHVLTVNACCKSSGLLHHEPHLLGTVTIPLRDIGTRAVPEGIMKSYDVHREAGAIQGSLFLSVKLGATRDLAQFEDPSAPHLSSYSSEKVDSSTMPSQKLPGSNRNDSTAANDNSHVAPTSRQVEKAFSSHTNIADPQVEDDVVMGYPATSVYGFDPLNQATPPHQRQAQGLFDPLSQYSAQNQHQLYENIRDGHPTHSTYHNGDQYAQVCTCNLQAHPQNYNCRRCRRRNCRGERRMQRKGRQNRRCRRGGPVKLVRMIILGPVMMGLRQLHRNIEHK